ncbi:MAG: DUF951 domain-containing protein [Clostridia bacterium]|nr:DUF951 domain-containing protein [Clostridia bacterium]
MQIIPLQAGDEVDMKKSHPCGNTRFRILRAGSDVRILCLRCGRDLTMDRLKFEKSIKKHYPASKQEDER